MMARLVLLFFVLSSFFFTGSLRAAETEPNNTPATSNTLPLNGSNNGAITASDVDWYKVTLTGDGALTYTITETLGQYASARLYDADGITELGYAEAANSTASKTVDGLAAGTYYIKINAYYDGQTPVYSISNALAVPTQANDAEPNNYAAQALTLPLSGTKTGHVGYYYNNQRDPADWYKITTTTDGAIKLNLTSGNNYYVSGYLFDADSTRQLGYVEVVGGTNSVIVDGLAAGVYYVKVNAYYNNQFVPYSITDSSFAPAQANDAEPNGTIAQANSLAVNGTTTGHVGYFNNGRRDTLDWFKIVAPKNGAIKLYLTSGNNSYVSARLYNEAGNIELKYVEVVNGITSVVTDGLGAGTYYVRVNAYYSDQFVPYVLTDSLLTYNPNDTLPNTYFSQAPTIPANRTVSGDVGFFFNTFRDTADTWKINYTGTDGNLNLTFGLARHIGDGGINYTYIQVYKDTAAAPIFSKEYIDPSTAISLTGLSQGYYYIKVFAYYNNQFNAYSITDNFTQVNIAAAAIQNARPSLDSCGGNSITYVLSGSHSPYGVQLYRNGVKYDSVNVASDSARFGNLPAGNYYATVYGDGATDAAYGTSPVTAFVPPTPKNLASTNIGVHTATLNWAPFNCVKSYRVQYRLSTATTWTTLDDANDAVGTYSLSGLMMYTDYTWRVASVDTAQGTVLAGAYSDTLQFRTLSDTARIVRSNQVYDSTACSSNTLVYTLSNSVAPYTVQLYRYGAVYGTSVQATGTATFSSLPAGTYYATATGTGSGGSFGTSGVDTLLPPVPSGLDTMMVTSGSAEVTWTPLSCVSYFTIQYRKLGSASWTTVQADGTQSMDTLTGLQADTLYEWHLAAVDTTAGTMLMSSYSVSDTFRTMGTLPVTLISLVAKPVNNTVQVSWQTANEINSSYYVVQRSTDGVTFSTVGTVQSGAQHQYSFTDNSPARGKSYYRLRQVDKDGHYMDSKIVPVNFTGSSLLILYPNPAVNVVHINLFAQGKATLTVYDNNGKAVMQKVISDGTSTQHLNVSGLAAGTYTVVLQQADGSHQSARLVKQ